LLAGVEVLDRGQAIDPGQQQGREQGRGARQRVRRGLPADMRGIRRHQRIGGCDQQLPVARDHRRLEQEVIQHEGKVERGIAVPGTFGVDQHRTAGSEQHVLRADVPVHERQAGPGGTRDHVLEVARELRMAPGGGHQVRLDAQRMEIVVGGEPAGELPVARAAGVQPTDQIAHRGGLLRPHGAGQQPGLPHRVILDRQVAHREQAAAWVVGQRHRDMPGDDPGGEAQPVPFDRVPADRRVPVPGDLELGQGALDADGAAAGVDPPQLGRDAAGERRPGRSLAGSGEALLGQKGPGRRRNLRRAGPGHGRRRSGPPGAVMAAADQGRQSRSWLPPIRAARAGHGCRPTRPASGAAGRGWRPT
jgi:hypothetical protein